MPLRAGRRHAHRPLVHAGGLESDRSPSGGAITTGRLRFENPAYTTCDASFGVSKDTWCVNVYGENLSNSNASRVRQHRPVHRRADAAAAAGARRDLRLQVLKAGGRRARRCRGDAIVRSCTRSLISHRPWSSRYGMRANCSRHDASPRRWRPPTHCCAACRRTATCCYCVPWRSASSVTCRPRSPPSPGSRGCSRASAACSRSAGDCHVALQPGARGDRGVPPRGRVQSGAGPQLEHARRAAPADRRRCRRRRSASAGTDPAAACRRKWSPPADCWPMARPGPPSSCCASFLLRHGLHAEAMRLLARIGMARDRLGRRTAAVRGGTASTRRITTPRASTTPTSSSSAIATHRPCTRPSVWSPPIPATATT